MRKLTLAIILVGLVASAASTQGSVVTLLSDNFNNGGVLEDQNDNLATRQSGTLDPVTYKDISDYQSNGWEPAITSIVGDRLTLKTCSWFTPASYVGLNHNFTDANNLQITSQMFPDIWAYAEGHGVGAWLMLAFGQSQVFNWPGSVAWTTTNGIPTTGMAIVLRRVGANEVYSNGNLVASSNLGIPGYQYDLKVDINVPAWDGTQGAVSVSLDYWNAQHVDLLTNYSAGFTSNYIGFGAYAPTSGDFTQHAVDNLLITTTTVPEPCGLVAFGSGLLGLAGFAVRRRRS